MRYRLLKELPLDDAIGIVLSSVFDLETWADKYGDRDIFRSAYNDVWWYSWWSRTIGDVEFYKSEIVIHGTPDTIECWNSLFEGTDYEIPTT